MHADFFFPIAKPKFFISLYFKAARCFFRKTEQCVEAVSSVLDLAHRVEAGCLWPVPAAATGWTSLRDFLGGMSLEENILFSLY